MNSLLYAKLAKTNLSKNRQNILPYWLSCIGTVIMFYIMSTLSLSEGLKKMMGEATIQIVMQFGVYIIGLFAVIFLIYSNSFLAKRRKKEFGLFQILGMEKKHLAKVLFFESLYLWILSVGGGILLGILCYKLLFLVLLKLTRFQGTIHFAFNWKATGNTVVLFAVIFLINYLKSLHQIHAAQPIELLHGEQEGEREPKTKLLTAWIGLLCLGLGYYLALTCQNPMEAMDDVYQGENLTPVIREFEGIIKDGDFKIADNNLLKTHFLNVALKHNMETRKFRPIKIEQRAHIDGFVSVIDAMTVRQKYWEECGELLKNAA